MLAMFFVVLVFPFFVRLFIFLMMFPVSSRRWPGRQSARSDGGQTKCQQDQDKNQFFHKLCCHQTEDSVGAVTFFVKNINRLKLHWNFCNIRPHEFLFSNACVDRDRRAVGRRPLFVDDQRHRLGFRAFRRGVCCRRRQDRLLFALSVEAGLD